MAYVKATVIAFVASLIAGSAVGAYGAFTQALERLRPEDRATVLAPAISEAMNCAAFFVVVLVPLGIVIVTARRRWRRRPATRG